MKIILPLIALALGASVFLLLNPEFRLSSATGASSEVDCTAITDDASRAAAGCPTPQRRPGIAEQLGRN